MSVDLDRKHREMETVASRRETSSPLEVDSSRCGPEHGLRERASGDEPPARDTRPDRATGFDFQTSPRLLSDSFLTLKRFLLVYFYLLPARHAGDGLGRGYFFDR